MSKQFDTTETRNEYPNMLWAIAQKLDSLAELTSSNDLLECASIIREGAASLHDAEKRGLRQHDQLQKYMSEWSEMVNEFANGGGR